MIEVDDHVTAIAIEGQVHYVAIPEPFAISIGGEEMPLWIFQLASLAYARNYVGWCRAHPDAHPGPPTIPRRWVIGMAWNAN